MSALAPRLPGAAVLDLFAGSGALGLEALSRGAARATFVENDRRALACLRANIAALSADSETTVVGRDVFDYLDDVAEHFDVAVADPPYRRGYAGRLVARFVADPFARLLCVEHEVGEEVGEPAGAVLRRYGDSAVTFVEASDMQREEET